MTERINLENKVEPRGDAIAVAIGALASADGVERHAARVQLEEIGSPAVPALVRALHSPSEHGRWEAAKALGEIADPRAAPALVDALEDEKASIRWLAATALINLGRGALVPVLRGMESNCDSYSFREGAHRVLHSLVKDGVADEAIPVLEALEDIEPRVEAPVAAYHLLQDLRKKRRARAQGTL